VTDDGTGCTRGEGRRGKWTRGKDSAHALALTVHKAVERFPRNRFGQLKSQLTRAVEHDQLCDEVTRIRKMLFALRKKVLATLDGKRSADQSGEQSGIQSGNRPGSAENLSRPSVTDHPQPITPNQQRQSRDNSKL
jgi:hypothetical protein